MPVKGGWKWEKPRRFPRSECRSDYCEGERGENFKLQCGSKKVSAKLMGCLI